jgi:oxalate decarboxylase
MAATLLRLQKGAVREPHWHPNAAELNYCIIGNAKMTIFGTNAHTDIFNKTCRNSFYSKRILA